MENGDDHQSVVSSCQFDVKLWCLMSDRHIQRAFDSQVSAEDILSIGMWNGCVIIQEDGRVFWTHQVPQPLQEKLVETQSKEAKPEYVVLGPSGYYFLRLSDEQIFFQGPVNFCETIKQYKHKQIKLVAFGQNSAWFILYEDGWFEWNDLPGQLYKTLNGNTYNLPELEYLAMGPQGQWFLRYQNGSCRVFIQNKEILRDLREINKKDGQIEIIAFGKKNTYCILHSNIIEDTEDMDDEEEDENDEEEDEDMIRERECDMEVDEEEEEEEEEERIRNNMRQ
eukprot:TRINITY_DN20103_c0_g2_i1.p1 TRINITY_DN20103_c0_g2~~TRINITY_DN20103_c0_g2_i1.p1  ORF type:complete len:281 (-),score=58.60 TRINITY_DN20103_c0_g2_i1:139-981(-)